MFSSPSPARTSSKSIIYNPQVSIEIFTHIFSSVANMSREIKANSKRPCCVLFSMALFKLGYKLYYYFGLSTTFRFQFMS